jgi:hypothetical protein
MRRVLVLGVVVAALTGCGYGLPGGTAPAGARTIAIHLFENRTREAGIEVAVRRALEEEFRRHGKLRVVSEGEADLQLNGNVVTLQSYPVASSGIDEALQYQVVLRASIRLTERETGRVLYENRFVDEQQDFAAVSGVVISSSPHFQRGTVNVRDLLNMTNAQLGEARRRDATRDLVRLLARDIYQQTMEGF